MPVRRCLASDPFVAAPIRSDKSRAVLRNMIELYRQEPEVAFRPDLKLGKCYFAVEQNRKIDRFINLLNLSTSFSTYKGKG
jgi:hypothetical protein